MVDTAQLRAESSDRALSEHQLAVIRQIQQQGQQQSSGEEREGNKREKRITVEDLLESPQPDDLDTGVSQHCAHRRMRIRAHHRTLLERLVQTDLKNVNAPGFPKAAHARNPTSTFIKPDMMIGAFTAGLTTQQTLAEMPIPGYPNGLFGNSIRNCPSEPNSIGEDKIINNLLSDEQADTHDTGDIMSTLSRSPNYSEVPAAVSALLTAGTWPQNFAATQGGQDRGNPQNQKMRKPFFMPYMCRENVERGLRNGDLVKGVLRVNQRNFEESYIDNPEGDDLQDIMILGVHDRNRALHGDVVVVRLKDRNHWIVRDSLYEAWRTGHMKLPCDDDGRPLTVPPVRVQKESDEAVQLSQAVEFLPTAHQVKVDKEKIKEPVPFPKNKRYGQEMMLRIAAQMELQRIQHEQKTPSTPKRSDNSTMSKPTPINQPVELDGKAVTQISRLNITRNNKFFNDTNASSNTQAQNSLSSRRANGFHSGNTLQRRLNYRVLGDMPDDDWGIPDVCLQKTGEVVFIYEQKNCRTAVGQLKVMADGNRNWGLFSPNDSRIPRMFIPANELPDGFFDRPHDFSKFIFIARLVEWQATAQFARGRLYKSLGTAGDIDAETEGLLISNDVDTREFSNTALASLPVTDGAHWTIDEKEFSYRRDFRSEVLFTIDPSTARDLDDALHIKPITDCDGQGNPGWEVGVHIADVSYFLQPNTELDKWAEHRATSVYLVHKVIPMLPRILCEELCSLNPGVDRLTFSVVWKMDAEGNIKDQWFGRSVIHSCVKLAYDHAQEMIENPTKEFVGNELPTIYNAKTFLQIKECVLNLNTVATSLKKKRVDNGALRLDAEKLKFVLDHETGMPIGVGCDERRDANFLVEEFMLLANQSVARRIEEHFPDTAILRRHPSPKQKVLRDMAEKCELLQYPIEVEDSKSIAQSLREYYDNPRLRTSVFPVLVQFMMKCMQLAVYFCSGTQKNYHHYALNVPFYTHFTSPIRRYPDVIVHRLLAASLGYSPPPPLSTQQLEVVCQHCNDRKVNAKAVSDQSAEMFFSLLIKQVGQLDVVGVVVGVLDAAVDVYLLKYNLVKRVYTNRLKLSRDSRFIEGNPGALILFWDPGYVAQVRQTKEKSAVSKVSKDVAESTDSDEEDRTEDSDGSEQDTFSTGADFEQCLTVFSLVRLMLTPSTEPVKFVATIVPTPDKYPMKQKEIRKLLD